MVTTCDGNDGSATVTPSGGNAPYTYLWDNGETDSIADTLTVGIHTVTVTDAAGCVASIQVIIDGPTGITATVSGTDVTCYGDSDGTVVVSVSGGTAPYTFLWNPQVGGLTDSAVTGLSAGTYTIMITDADGCMATVSAVINVSAPPVADAGENSTISSGESISLSGSGGTGYSWSSDPSGFTSNEQNPTATPSLTTIYYLTVTDANGCVSKDSVLITVSQEVVVYVPTLFSPNNDGENDKLYVYGDGVFNLKFVIYDRWGEKVYETEEVIQNGDVKGAITSGWNGTYRNKKMNPAVFAYYLESNDGTIIKEGNITLIK